MHSAKVPRRSKFGKSSFDNFDNLFFFCFLSYLYLQPKKVKNISHDVFGTKTGRIHMQKQDLNKLQTRKVKALKRTADKTDDNNKTKRKKTKV